jgi:hypothetical protein
VAHGLTNMVQFCEVCHMLVQCVADLALDAPRRNTTDGQQSHAVVEPKRARCGHSHHAAHHESNHARAYHCCCTCQSGHQAQTVSPHATPLTDTLPQGFFSV